MLEVGHFNDRLRLAIGGHSTNSFALKCGLTESLLRKYLSGMTLPGLDKLVAISNSAEVNIEWLATGEGPMKRGAVPKAVPGGIDEEALEAAVELSDELLASLGRPATVKQKTQLLLALYDLAIEKEDHQIDRPAALRLVKLMAA